MVRGTKRKIPMEKIKKRESLATCFSKRSAGLYSKASQLCLLSDMQIAILATPSSSQSNVSFYSFGHSSVDSVVSAFLSGERPVPAPISSDNKQMREDVCISFSRNDLGLGFWWEDESLHRSENPEEIKDALESMSSLLTQLRSMKDHDEDLKKKEPKKMKDVVSNHGTQLFDQTLNPVDDSLKTDTEIVVFDDSSTENFDNGLENMNYEDLLQLLNFETTFEGL